MRIALFFPLLIAFGCEQPDETVTAYAPQNVPYVLQNTNYDADLMFGDAGQIRGNAPCNSYSAQLQVPYPWFEIGPIITPKRACPDLAQEIAFFKQIESMTFIEVTGNILILTNEAGDEMLFQSAP